MNNGVAAGTTLDRLYVCVRVNITLYLTRLACVVLMCRVGDVETSRRHEHPKWHGNRPWWPCRVAHEPPVAGFFLAEHGVAATFPL